MGRNAPTPGTHTQKGKRRTLVRAAQDGSPLGALVMEKEVQRAGNKVGSWWRTAGGRESNPSHPCRCDQPTSASLIGRRHHQQQVNTAQFSRSRWLTAQNSLCSMVEFPRMHRTSSSGHVPRHSSLPPRGTVLPSAPDPLLPRGLHCTSCIHTFHTARTNPH
jgi:hypothetical protein